MTDQFHEFEVELTKNSKAESDNKNLDKVSNSHSEDWFENQSEVNNANSQIKK